MNADIAEVVRMIVAVNAAAVPLLLVMSFIGSALALEGLDKLDTWMRRMDEKRLFWLNAKAASRALDHVSIRSLSSTESERTAPDAGAVTDSQHR
jgi:hypothetical protein